MRLNLINDHNSPYKSNHDEKIFDIRKYTISNQQRFAELSGDFNPLHLDSIRGRREIFGDVVVHGIHGVLRALEAYLAMLRQRGVRTVALQKLSGKFPAPIYSNQRVKTYLVDEKDGCAKLQTRDSEQLLLEIEVGWISGMGKTPSNLPVTPPTGQNSKPLDLTLEELRYRSGKLSLHINSDLAVTEFPNLVALTSLGVIAEILATTRLVGMECPGLHSILSSFDIDFHAPTGKENSIVPPFFDSEYRPTWPLYRMHRGNVLQT